MRASSHPHKLHSRFASLSMERFRLLLFHLQRSRKSLYALISLLCFSLLAYNSAKIFCTHIEPAAFTLPEVPSTARSATLRTHLLIPRKTRNLAVSGNGDGSTMRKAKGVNEFETRVMEFFQGKNSSDYLCEFRFFMTWVSTKKPFGDREIFAVTSLFKFHPNACLIIASSSLDSRNGMKILRPFWSRGLKVTAISPDFAYLFNNTPGFVWYNQLLHGNVNPGEVPLGQNLSNLLRLGFLYRFGGIYVDTDVIILKSFKGLSNVIGAQTIDLSTGNWSRLNNAVMIFDEKHPLIFKFIQEFALTFDGNKWGHNGPYLVSRVVSRVGERPGYNNFSVLSPAAFYPVDWSRIGRLFEGPKNTSHSKWLDAKMRQICSKSFGVHLWNKQSKWLEIEKGSIIEKLLMLKSVVDSNNSFTE